MHKELCPDVAVVGGGVAGLMTATRLSEKGYKVSLVEKTSAICSGPSIRNEGWLHPGTYHSTSIKDQAKALEVAKRCQYGYKVIRQLSPESINEDNNSYAIFKDTQFVDYAQERWDQAEVWYQHILLRELAQICPEVNLTPIQKAFQVKDVSLNTRLLYKNLLDRTQDAGGEFLLNSMVETDEQGQAWVRNTKTGELAALNTQLVINTTGLGMQEFLSGYFNEEYGMRFWKSHLIVYPRLGKNNVFYLEPGEAAAFQHGRYTIVGQHEDATLEQTPTYQVIPEKSQSVREATNRIYPGSSSQVYLETACLKPDLSRGKGEARSLGVEIYEPQPGFIFALPGKMTESPYVADLLVAMAEDKNIRKSQVKGGKRTTIPVAPRPCDNWNY